MFLGAWIVLEIRLRALLPMFLGARTALGLREWRPFLTVPGARILEILEWTLSPLFLGAWTALEIRQRMIRPIFLGTRIALEI